MSITAILSLASLVAVVVAVLAVKYAAPAGKKLHLTQVELEHERWVNKQSVEDLHAREKDLARLRTGTASERLDASLDVLRNAAESTRK